MRLEHMILQIFINPVPHLGGMRASYFSYSKYLDRIRLTVFVIGGAVVIGGKEIFYCVGLSYELKDI